MTDVASAAVPTPAASPRRLGILLAMAMFVLVVDTSLMNVSISAVVHDLHTKVSSVQSAIALEALVSAAFILISSKIGDLIGREPGVCAGVAGVRCWCAGDGPGPKPHAGHHLLGDRRRSRCVASFAGDAVTSIHRTVEGAAQK